MVVISTLLSQSAQTGASRDTAAALARFTKLVAASRAQAIALREQVVAARLSAEASLIQANATRRQLDIMRQTSAVAERNADAAVSLAALAKESQRAEQQFRQRIFATERAVLVAAGLQLSGLKSDPDEYGVRDLRIRYRFANKGRTALTIRQMTLLFAAGRAERELGITTSPLAVHQTIPAGDEWTGFTEPIVHITPEQFERMKGSERPHVYGYVDFDEPTGERHRTCFDYEFVLTPDEDKTERFWERAVDPDECRSS